MASIQIIVGSMLGGTEYVAEACQETLEESNHSVSLHLKPIFNDIPQKDQTWLICTSTHGAGDYPDNIQSFIQDLENTAQDLSSISFLIIGLGDSSYDTFCLAAKNTEKLLLSKGCNIITETKYIDMQDDLDPELESQAWISQINDHLS